MMATRTTRTRTTAVGFGLSANQCNAEDHLSFEELVAAYFDCRRTKRNTRNALEFEQDLERNLGHLYGELVDGTYYPGRSICFVITRPKPREVWAAAFRDRVVHHLLYNRIGPRFERSFIVDSCACIKGRGTLYAAQRLEAKVRSITQNWSRRAFYLKCDLANFFVSVDKRILLDLLLAKIPEPFWRALTECVLMQDPRTDFEYRGDPMMMQLVPPHKRLMEQAEHLGLPIGNLSSQFFANVYLDVLDQRAKHVLGARHYIRYVDDFVFLHESPAQLNEMLADVTAFLPARLGVSLNPRKTILQPIDRGVDFVGQVIKPWHRTTRKRTRNEALRRVAATPAADLLQVANSYFGLLRQATASHADRAWLANILRSRGHSIDRDFLKTFRKGEKA
ncbi:retron-type reverse transcriptase [Burkholderia pseudomallei]|nr:retron-type reverse transcriptase [Burkholderia pseudomallei]